MNEPIFNEKYECIGSVQCTDEFRPGNKEFYEMTKFGKDENWSCIDPTCPLMIINYHSGVAPSIGRIKLAKQEDRAEIERIYAEKKESALVFLESQDKTLFNRYLLSDKGAYDKRKNILEHMVITLGLSFAECSWIINQWTGLWLTDAANIEYNMIEKK